MPIMELLLPYILPLLLGGLGYLFVYYFWEPIRQMDIKKQEIVTVLSRDANIRQRTSMKKNSEYDGPGDLFEEVLLNQNEVDQTTHKLRQLAGELRSIINTKKTYPLLSFLRLVPHKSRVENTAKSLIGWSNSFGQKDQSKLIGDFINNITENLEIPVT